MIAFSKEVCERKTRIFGSRGELEGDMETATIKHFDFATQKSTIYKPEEEFRSVSKTKMMGHGGADYFLMKSFVAAIAKNDPSKVLTNAKDTLMSHLAVFAAEKSRLENKIYDLSW